MSMRRVGRGQMKPYVGWEVVLLRKDFGGRWESAHLGYWDERRAHEIAWQHSKNGPWRNTHFHGIRKVYYHG